MSKSVLLTGGAGFIGHHTCEHILKNTDWNIIIMDRLTYAGNLNRLTDIDCWEAEKGRVHFVYHDFRAEVHLGLLKGLPVDYIIHMGAESHVDKSIGFPNIFAESNVLGTVNMLNLAIKLRDLTKFVYVSTDEVYGPSINGHLHLEGEPHKPGNPYSASKAGAEDFVLAYRNTYNMPAIITNTMNNYGERQDPEKFVPKTILSILRSEPVTIHVKKDKHDNIVDISSRCWLHARNHADALIFLLVNDVPLGERYNITGKQVDVLDMACRIAAIMNRDAVFDEQDFHSFRPGHDMHYGLDGTKLAGLGWVAPYSLDKSLEHTVRWSIQKENQHWLGL